MQRSNTTSVVTPRRFFSRHLLSEAIGLAEELCGKTQIRLSDLDQIPDEIVRKMMPVLNKDRFYAIRDDRVLLWQKKSETFQELCRLDEQQCFILRYFDGQYNLEKIGSVVAEEFGESPDSAYQQSKALFLFLAKRAICFPAHAHDEDDNELRI